MNDFSGNRNGRVSITRREFLGATSSLFFTVAFGGVHSDRSLAQNIGEAADLPLTAWIRLDSDNTITIYNPAAEMGQGTMTALLVIVAEEMDADWAQVLIENSPTDPDLYGNPGWFWGTPMMTVGSRAVLGLKPAGLNFSLARKDLKCAPIQPIMRVDTTTQYPKGAHFK